MFGVSKRKKYAVLLVFGLLAFTTGVAFAASPAKTLVSVAQSMVDTIFGMDSLNNIATILTTEISETYPAVWELVKNTVDNTVTPIAYSLLGIYLVLTWINVGMNPQQATAEQFIRPLIWFVAASILIYYTPRIIVFGISFAGDLSSQLVESAQDAIDFTSAAEEIKDYISLTGSASMNVALMYVGQMFFPWLCKQVTNIILTLLAWSAVIEVLIRGIFLPLSYGPMIMHGFSHEGTKYLRAFLASCVKIALMVMVSIIINFMMSTQLVSVDPEQYAVATVSVIVIEIACVFLMMGCGRIANDLFGV